LGLGLSSRPKKKDYSFRLADRVSDLSALINSLNLTEPVHLVAHDWGGPIGLGWAGANPSLVKSITLMNTGLRIPAGYQPPTSLGIFMTGLWGQFLANRANLFLSGILRYGSVRPIPPGLAEGYLAPYSHSLLRGAIGRFVKDIPLKPSHPSFGALKNADLAFDELVRPTLFIWGLQDFVFTPAFLEDFMARRPEAQVLALPRSGHLLLEDEPDKISAALEDFFTKIPKASGPEVLGHGQ
jgi:haloalkane dehalogenase